MKEVSVRMATADDAVALGERLAPLDAAECVLRSGLPGWNAVLRSWAMSTRCMVAEIDGQVVAMWGVVTTGARVGEVWLLTTDLSDYRREFVSTFYEELSRAARGYQYLYNYVWTEQRAHIRLLTRIGVVFDYEDTIVRNGQTLVKFIWRCDNV